MFYLFIDFVLYVASQLINTIINAIFLCIFLRPTGCLVSPVACQSSEIWEEAQVVRKSEAALTASSR
jgi:hypothetical protein